MMRVAVLISGRGTNLQALIEDQSHYRITHVLSDQAQAKGLDVAHKHGIKTTWIKWSDRGWAEQQAMEILDHEAVDLVVLAGFMRILTADFVNHFKQRLINIHPSLLPLYPGLNTHQRALDDGQSQHGATVHYVDEQLDHGPGIAQTHIPIDPADDAKSLEQKLLPKEHKLLTHCVGLIAQNRVHWHNNRLMHDGTELTEPMVID